MAENKILIVDDDREIRNMLSDFLRGKGYRVTETDSGTEAIQSMKRELPHLVITDLLLPGEHGLDLIRMIKKQWFVPVIVLSGVYRQQEVLRLIQDEPVEAFFEKPVDLEKLYRAIRRLLDG